jgi:hypothetical protein
MTYQPPSWPPQPQPYGQQPPIVPGQNWGAPPPPFVPPPKKTSMKKRVVAVVAGVPALIVVAFGLSALSNDNSGTSSHPAAAVDIKAGSGDGTVADPADTPTADAVTPKASDFKLTPKITRKQCFGSAGCNVDYQVTLGYSGPALNDDDTWDVTYEATGDESGPITNQIEVTGTQYSGESQSISTASSGTKIKIKVTDVEKE